MDTASSNIDTVMLSPSSEIETTNLLRLDEVQEMIHEVVSKHKLNPEYERALLNQLYIDNGGETLTRMLVPPRPTPLGLVQDQINPGCLLYEEKATISILEKFEKKVSSK